MNGSQNCPICDTPASIVAGTPIRKIDCPRCGQYEQSMPWWSITDVRHRILLSGWVREQNAVASVPIISQEVAARVTMAAIPRYRVRAARALAFIYRKHPSALSAPITYGQLVQDLELQACSYSANGDDVRTILQILQHEHLIQDKQNWGLFLTVSGLLAAEDMAASPSKSVQCFVAMWFDSSLNAAWTNGFDAGIRVAGFHPIRIDHKDYLGGITDEIMSEIRRSRFVVADYTGQPSGVYFEAGFALGLGLMVIPTCRSDEIASLHFDIKHLNTLPWHAPDDLAINLERRIRAVIGAGPGGVVPNRVG
jgi:hypothetical protein